MDDGETNPAIRFKDNKKGRMEEEIMSNIKYVKWKIKRKNNQCQAFEN